MNNSFTLLVSLILLSISMSAQDMQFLWANSYEVSNCNEVGALAVDTSDNIIIAGVHGGPVNIPYKGDMYIIKTDPDGTALWASEMDGELIMGDMAAMNTDIVIAGQAYGAFTYKDVQYGTSGFFLFVIKLDENGDVLWHYTDDEKNSSYAATLSVDDNSRILLHTRTQSNLGDWIMIFDTDGNILNSRLLSPTQTLIVHAEYYGGNVYLGGDVSGFSSVTIDTIFIPQSPVESTTFVLALDSTLTAKWVAIDTTLNNGDGTLEANENGVFVYEETLQPPFNIVHNLKRFSHDGQLLKEIVVPSYNPSALLLPGLALVGDRVALFYRNSSGNDSFKVLIYDEDLEIIQEMFIDGQSDQYSNQIAVQDKNFIISHVYQSTLNLNDEMTLPYEGTGKLPYIAKIGEPVISGITSGTDRCSITIFPNPATDRLFIQTNMPGNHPENIRIYDLSGRTMFKTSPAESRGDLDLSSLPAGIYLLNATFSNGQVHKEKLLIQ